MILWRNVGQKGLNYCRQHFFIHHPFILHSNSTNPSFPLPLHIHNLVVYGKSSTVWYWIPMSYKMFCRKTTPFSLIYLLTAVLHVVYKKITDNESNENTNPQHIGSTPTWAMLWAEVSAFTHLLQTPAATECLLWSPDHFGLLPPPHWLPHPTEAADKCHIHLLSMSWK